MKTALVEREHLGGICLNWGCIPTKALLRSAEIYDLLHHWATTASRPTTRASTSAKVVKRVAQRGAASSRGVGFLMKKNKIKVIDGEAQAGRQGQAGGQAQGRQASDDARRPSTSSWRPAPAPAQLPGLEPDGKLIWTYREAMVPEAMPKSLLVIGSGAIGIEFASFYRDLGAEVTVVEVLHRILPVEDEEISAFAHKAFEKRASRSAPAAKVKALQKGADNVTATIEAGGKSEEITVDRVIIAVGIVGNVENIGLEGPA